jgi:hypothetical protein
MSSIVIDQTELNVLETKYNTTSRTKSMTTISTGMNHCGGGLRVNRAAGSFLLEAGFLRLSSANFRVPYCDFLDDPGRSDFEEPVSITIKPDGF